MRVFILKLWIVVGHGLRLVGLQFKISVGSSVLFLKTYWLSIDWMNIIGKIRSRVIVSVSVIVIIVVRSNYLNGWRNHTWLMRLGRLNIRCGEGGRRSTIGRHRKSRKGWGRWSSLSRWVEWGSCIVVGVSVSVWWRELVHVGFFHRRKNRHCTLVNLVRNTNALEWFLICDGSFYREEVWVPNCGLQSISIEL